LLKCSEHNKHCSQQCKRCLKGNMILDVYGNKSHLLCKTTIVSQTYQLRQEHGNKKISIAMSRILTMKLAKMRLLCSWDITHLPSMNCKMHDHKQRHVIYRKDKFQNKSRKSSGRTGTLITTNSQIKHNRIKQANKTWNAYFSTIRKWNNRFLQ
jgi:hypothetical protein